MPIALPRLNSELYMQDENEKPRVKSLDRAHFLSSLYLTELILVVLALVITRLASGSWLPYGFNFTAENLLLGLLAAVPVALMILLASFGPISKTPVVEQAMNKITLRLKRLLGSTIPTLSAIDIVLLSIAAGIGEELFFRGMLQSYIGIFGAAMIFGLLHALTPAYFVLATAIGLYFGYLYESTNNLLIPMIGHAAYDVFAVYLLKWSFTRH